MVVATLKMRMFLTSAARLITPFSNALFVFCTKKASCIESFASVLLKP